ncbi:hypothetical protein QN277_010892 [Acacia crassicarpa]|uniref:Uncharacterized protein n=1 Tax=Acacia crassicarpa TaxID=499986 RepID=A0AAE1IML9_9FABA|nr:hypothetical protein QN277_010887 [Acacia crassicarpa]KAK4253064.1 hypothetical protein QN277_010888 [Acacia crassicarpa]KAK4253065.1 hypothetical protein QN277_010889 [Acacia crassicarpa]KAK4253066.1 hypothetical protein QN277_010890 [Acacia crassicarpa]KAK4253067.1 hypothetical protein QN277_010891 [Acacia crassicarpa]
MPQSAPLISPATPYNSTLVRQRHSARPYLLSVRAEAGQSPPDPLDSPPESTPPQKLNRYRSRITQPKSQGRSLALLHGVGLSEQHDMRMPQIGISSMWYEGNTSNLHLFPLS